MGKGIAYLAAVALIGAAPASAADRDVTSAPVAQLLTAIARSYWGANTCPGAYHVLVGPLITPGAGGEAPQPGCWMRISPASWVESRAPSAALAYLCALVVHEYGHSLGRGHNGDPLSVMDPADEFTTGMPSACVRIGDWGSQLEFESLRAEDRCLARKEREALRGGRPRSRARARSDRPAPGAGAPVRRSRRARRARPVRCR